MRKVILISILSVFFFSCEKETNIPIPDQEPKLAVSCFISPGDTVVEVFVYLSEPIFAVSNSTTGVLQNATVVLGNGIVSIPIPYNSAYACYRASLAAFPIGYNTTYYLSVTDAQGRQVTAKTTTPSSAFPYFEASQTTHEDPDNNVRYDVNCKINDISGEENYYRVCGGRVTYNPATVPDTTVFGEGMYVFADDRGSDGNTLNVNVEIYAHTYDIDSTAYKARRVTVVKCNREFYNFHLSITNANFSGGNPFAEPTIIYSNMGGGYGCFGAYTMRHKDIPY